MSQPYDFLPYVPMTKLDELRVSPNPHDEHIISERSREGRVVSALPQPHVTASVGPVDSTDWPYCPFGSIPRNHPRDEREHS